MPRVEFAPEAIEDFERILEHLIQSKTTDAASRVKEISDAIKILEQNPLIGKPAPP